MRTKNLFLALALPAMFAACSNEEFVMDNATPAEGNLVELGEGFVLAGQGIDNATTKSIWESGENGLGWSWLPIADASSTGTVTLGATAQIKVDAERIGLCWTGELADGTGSISSKVFTNYEFLHAGWLGTGATEADFDNCTGVLNNGKLYADIAGTIAADANAAAIKAVITGDDNKVTVTANAPKVKLDPNTGVFQTENKAIFGGSYIVYYPYNGDFKDAGCVPATAGREFDEVAFAEDAANKTNAALQSAHVAKNTFLVGYAKDLIGGSKASKFSLNPLSAIISLQLKQIDGTTGKVITKVALWSDNGFVTSANLDASKIKSSGAKGGETLYVGEKETTSTIVATLGGDESTRTLRAGADAAYKKMYLPVLPTTLNGLKVIVYDKDGAVAVKELAGEFKFAAAAGKSVKVDLKADDFKANTLIAVDAASFKEAVKTAGTQAAPKTVQVIGDITLNADETVNSWITVEGGKIVVPEDKTLTVADKAAVKSEVDVEGFSCCGTSVTDPGRMVVAAGGSIAGKVNLLEGQKATENKGGKLTFNGGQVTENAVITAENSGEIAFAGATDVLGTLTLKAGAKAEVAVAGEVNVKGGTVNNSGTVEVLGNFAMLAKDGSTVATAGKNFKNNGKFIDNVGAKVGGATQYMVFGEAGQYICKVDGEARMNEAYENKTAASVIDIVGTGGKQVIYTFEKVRKHNNKDVDIIVSANATWFKPGKEITIGNLTVNNGLRIKKTEEITGDKGAHVGWATITVNGDIEANKNLILEEDVRGMKAKNLTVKKNGSATFENRNESQDKTLVVSQTITVEKDGKFEIKAKETGKNIALVTCTKLVEGGTFSGKPEVVAE